MLFNVNDTYVGRSLDLYGEYSEGEVELFRSVIDADDTVVDVGANIGTHTLFFARQVGPRGRVLAFEPQRIVFQTLCANMALNSMTNAWCYPQALGAEAGESMVPPVDYHAAENIGGVPLGEYRRGERVAVITLDSLALEACRLIKIDVEGMEEQVLRGSVHTLERLKPILYVENDREERSHSLVRCLHEFGYAMYWHRTRLFNPGNFAGNADNVFGNIASHNMLCVHGSVAAQVSGLMPVQLPDR